MAQEGRRVKQKELAKRLEVSERTLRNWKKYAMEGSFPKVGRPEMKTEQVNKLKCEIEAEWIEQGKPGWRCIKVSNKKLPTRLIQKTLSELKLKDRRQRNNYKKEHSKRVNVLHKNIIWSQDTTFNKGGELALEVIKDRGSLSYVCVDSIGIPSAENVKRSIVNSCVKRRPPLVLMTDNGSGYKSREFKRYLHENSIIHLESLPRCPEHNGAEERGIRELKYTLNEVGVSLEDTVGILNTKRRYASKGYLTAQEFEELDKVELSCERRKIIYAKYEKKMLRLKKEEPNVRRRKLIERKFVFDLLEKEGLIKQQIGSLKL